MGTKGRWEEGGLERVLGGEKVLKKNVDRTCIGGTRGGGGGFEEE